MYIGSNQPVQYPKQVNGYYGNQQSQGISPFSNVYVNPYKQDSYVPSNYNSGNFTAVYSFFSKETSPYSPFYRGFQDSNQPVQTQPVQPVQTQPVQPVQTQPVQSVQTQPVVKAREIPQGPAQTDINTKLVEEIKTVTNKQQAVQLIANHIISAVKERELANDITWGAKYYSKQALDLSQKILENKDKLTPSQKQQYLTKVQEYRDKSIATLNEAKKHAIITYNEILKATLIYNHFFTEKGSMVNQLTEQERQILNSQLDEALKRWENGFEKDWQGTKVVADPANIVIDKTADIVAVDLDKMNQNLLQIQ